jgi:hypothetical protein
MIPESAGTPFGTPPDAFFSFEAPSGTTQSLLDLNFPVAPDLQQIPGAHPFLMDTESDISNSTLVLSNARVSAISEFLRTMHQAYIEDSRSNPMEWGDYVYEILQCALTYAYTSEFQGSSTSPEMPWNSEMTHEDYARYRQMQPEEFERSDSGYTTGTLSYAGQAL